MNKSVFACSVNFGLQVMQLTLLLSFLLLLPFVTGCNKGLQDYEEVIEPAPQESLTITLLGPRPIDNDSTPTVRVGQTTAQSIVALFSDPICSAGSKVAEVTASGSIIDFTISPALSDGDYTFYARSINKFDKVSACIGPASYTLDTTIPTISGIENDSNTLLSKTWNWSCSDPNDSCTFRYQLDQDPNTTLSGSYSDTNTISQSAVTGTYYLHVDAIDRAGNTSVTTTVSAIFDNTAPTITGLSNDTVPTQSKTWTWSSDDPNAVYKFVVDLNASTDPNTAYGTTTTATQPNGDATYYLHLRARDEIGNESDLLSVSAILDNLPPILTIEVPSATRVTSGDVVFPLTYSNDSNTITLDNNDVTLNTTGNLTGTIGVGGSGVNRSVTISGITGVGVMDISVAATTASDIAENWITTVAESVDVSYVHSKVLQMDTGGDQTCAILPNRDVKCWGRNSDGQLGQGNNIRRGDSLNEMGDNLARTDLGTNLKAIQISVGDTHVCAILNDRSVKCWGDNSRGQLGLGNTNDPVGRSSNDMGDNLSAVNLGTGRKALQIATGADFTCAILDDSSLKCWGNNQYGQLGIGSIDNVGRDAVDMGDNLQSVDLGTGLYAVQVALGSDHACALLNNSTVKCWGRNDAGFGYLGLGDTNNRGQTAGTMGDNLPTVDLGTGRTVRYIAAATRHTCAILDNSRVKCWGDGQDGALGSGDITDRGNNPTDMGDNLAYVDLGTNRQALELSMGLRSSCALLDGGDVKCWGFNSNGELGLGDVDNRGDGPGEMGDTLVAVNLGTGVSAIAISSGESHHCALLSNSGIKCWGDGSFGQLGQESTATLGDSSADMGDNIDIIELSYTGRIVRQVDAGGETSCALTGESSVKCWGGNVNGQLGLETTEDIIGDSNDEMGADLNIVNLGTGRFAREISVGSEFACAVLDDLGVKCWGLNNQGQLGQGDDTSRGRVAGDMSSLAAISLDGNVLQVHSGGNTNCATMSDSNVKCWGNGSEGQLGDGGTVDLGDNAGEMGGNLSPISFGSTTFVSKYGVSTADTHTCTIKSDSNVLCWGAGNFGKLGREDTNNYIDPSALTDINLGGRRVRNIQTAQDNTCAILSDSNVVCWGRGSAGVNGQESSNNIGAAGTTMGANLTPIDFGTDGSGVSRTAYQLALGNAFACTILDNFSVKCWGTASNGEFGDGSGSSVYGTGGSTMGDNLPTVDLGGGRFATQVTCGSEHVCALLDDSSVKCWGRNNSGQLGLGDLESRGDNADEMGNDLDNVNLFKTE